MKKTLLIFLGIVLAVESATAHWIPPITAQRDFAILRAKKDLARQKLDAELLIMGDSSGGLGIDPLRLSRETGLKTVSLSLLAPCNSTAHLLLLKDYLKNNPKPRAVLLMNALDIWWRDVWMTEPWPPGTSLTFQMDVMTRLFGFDFWKALLGYKRRHPEAPVPFNRLFHAFLPSQNYSADLRAGLEKNGTFWRESARRRTQYKNQWRQLLENQGDYRHYLYADALASAKAHDEQSITADGREDREWMRRRSFKVSPFSRDSLEQFLRFTAKEGIEVWVAFPPLWDVFKNDPQTQKFLADHNLFLKSLGKNDVHVRVITEDFYWAKTAELLNSVEHLTVEMQKRFTDQLAQKINSLPK